IIIFNIFRRPPNRSVCRRISHFCLTVLTLQIALLTGCAQRARPAGDADPGILSELTRLRAIDNHAHPVRFVGAGEPDREFDALPVDNMEPASDPLQLRPDDPGVLQSWQSLWNYPYRDTSPQHIREWTEHKQRASQQRGDGYPSWVLDSLGIDVM